MFAALNTALAIRPSWIKSLASIYHGLNETLEREAEAFRSEIFIIEEDPEQSDEVALAVIESLQRVERTLLNIGVRSEKQLENVDGKKNLKDLSNNLKQPIANLTSDFLKLHSMIESLAISVNKVDQFSLDEKRAIFDSIACIGVAADVALLPLQRRAFATRNVAGSSALQEAVRNAVDRRKDLQNTAYRHLEDITPASDNGLTGRVTRRLSCQPRLEVGQKSKSTAG